jgi:adenylate kinase
MQFDTIFFIGPQGSGKGTQAKILADRLGFFYWEMGGILRETAKNGTPLGDQVGQLIDQGVLLSDDILLNVVEQRLDQIPKNRGIIFDGIPRRVGQAEFLLDFLKTQGRSKMLTLFIDLPREDSLERLLLRAQTEGRKDDTEQAINFRLDQYEHDTIPVLAYMKEHSQFFTIDGRPAIEVVTANINRTLGLDHA